MELTRERIESRVAKLPDAPGCWLWTMYCDKDGYGTCSRLAGERRAHRASYVTHVGKIPDAMMVCHRCDNPSCVNPEHLFLGTAADNMVDKARKGRAARGESARKSSLTDDDVRAIRRSTATQDSLAKVYGVSQVQIGNIMRRRSWAHVSDGADTAGAF